MLLAGGYNGSSLYLSNAELFVSVNGPVPLQITGISAQTNGVLITWQAPGGSTDVVQATAGASDGGYTSNFSDLGNPIVMGISSATNYLDVDATNSPARYYRIKTTF